MSRASLVLACLLGSSSLVHAGNELGVNTHVPATDVVQVSADLGAHWIRVDNNWFQTTDPCSGSIGSFAPLDGSVNDAVARGLKVYMTLAYTPACASLDNSDDTNLNDVPDPTLYGSYVRQAVAHYRALGVTHFGLWNEANLGGFFEGSANQYVDNIVLPGLAAVAAGCGDAGFSDCQSLGPDLAHVGDYDVFLEDVLVRMNNASASFDILAHHIYQGHDVSPFSGDSFYNALQERRFSFTRRSLVNVLTDVGLATDGVPSIEVWITETGYHNRPATSASEMSAQRDYAMNTIDEQMARDWYTNTFFYEILDSNDDLDGFGITRREAAGFFLKDAYLALQTRVATDPGYQEMQADPDAGPMDATDAGPSNPSNPDAGPASTGGDAGDDMGGDEEGSSGCAAGGRQSGGLVMLMLILLGLCRARRRVRPQR